MSSPKESAILSDPCSSYWLKLEIKNSRQRDMVDALNDAEALVAVLKARIEDQGTYEELCSQPISRGVQA